MNPFVIPFERACLCSTCHVRIVKEENSNCEECETAKAEYQGEEQ